jgi:hypothetical protein
VFGASPVFFGIGELDGFYSSGGTGTQTITSQFSETIDLTKLAVRQDLVAGFYNGQSTGSGITNITFDLYANGTDIDHQSFSTVTAATAYFTNNGVDMGSLAGSGSTLSVNAQLKITTTGASSFDAGILIGDPPSAASASKPAAIPALASSGVHQFI